MIFKYVIGARTIGHPNSYNRLEGIVTAETSGEAILKAIADQYFDSRRPIEEEAANWHEDFLTDYEDTVDSEDTNWCFDNGEHSYDVEVEEV